MLHLQILKDGLHNEIGVGERLVVERRHQPRQARVALKRCQLWARPSTPNKNAKTTKAQQRTHAAYTNSLTWRFLTDLSRFEMI